MKVLFVCLGNICRSLTAQAVVRHRQPDWHTDSAGTANWHKGKPPYTPMKTVAEAHGYPMGDLRARQFHADDFAEFDLILVMDAQNKQDVEALRPQGALTPVLPMTEWIGGGDVPDPYYTRDFEGALGLIERAANALISHHKN